MEPPSPVRLGHAGTHIGCHDWPSASSPLGMKYPKVPGPPRCYRNPDGTLVACFQDDGLGGLAGACAQGSGDRVVGEGELLIAQVPDHVLGVAWVRMSIPPRVRRLRWPTGPVRSRWSAGRCGTIASSRAQAFFARPASGAVAMVWPWLHQ